jgi:pyrimidine operon attenuation protein/uracil phosphoribosyltransferase
MTLPDAEELIRKLAQEIKPLLTADSALVGIQTGGVWIAERLRQQLGGDIPMGTLDISFYRDDFGHIGLHHEVKPSDIPFEVEGRHIILVDDVLYTGRTIRGAMNELFDYGRPASIVLAVLVDRGGRELPIAAQIVGQTMSLQPHQHIWLTRDTTGKLNLTLHENTEP